MEKRLEFEPDYIEEGIGIPPVVIWGVVIIALLILLA